jgi:hypothetical protein
METSDAATRAAAVDSRGDVNAVARLARMVLGRDNVPYRTRRMTLTLDAKPQSLKRASTSGDELQLHEGYNYLHAIPWF